MKKRQQGFSLIELMIVVAIIGVLSAVAVPAYQNYQVKAQVSDGIALAGTFKLQVSEHYTENGALPPDATFAAVSSTYATVNQDADGVLTIKFDQAAAASGIKDDSMTMTPTISGGTMKWVCASTAAATQVQGKYCPSSCDCKGT